MGTACCRLERAGIGVAACFLARARNAEVIPFSDSDTMLHVSLSCRTVAVSVTSYNTYISVLHTSLRLSAISATDLRCCAPMSPFAQSRFYLVDQSNQLFHQRKYRVPNPHRLNPQFLHIDQGDITLRPDSNGSFGRYDAQVCLDLC